MSDATYARCTEPTGSNARDGCGWTGEVERADRVCPDCHGFACDLCDYTGYIGKIVLMEHIVGGGDITVVTHDNIVPDQADKGFKKEPPRLASNPIVADPGPSGGRASGDNAQVTHDGEGRWPWDIDKCPNCGGQLAIDK